MTETRKPPPRLLYSIKDVMHLTSLSRGTIYRMMKAGQLRSVAIGGRSLIEAKGLHALIKNAPPAKPSATLRKAMAARQQGQPKEALLTPPAEDDPEPEDPNAVWDAMGRFPPTPNPDAEPE